MTITAILEKLYTHAFDMVKFGETKNTVLIAFNAAIVIGLTKLGLDSSNSFFYYYALWVIFMCAISIFICFVALIAKIKHKALDLSLPINDNPLFFATIAHMTHEELLENLKLSYGCIEENAKYERDLAKQAVITSQIASRKFKLFNVAIGFTICGVFTPISIIIYKLFLDQDILK